MAYESGKVLVTGASGFIGGRLRDTLLSSGAEVVSLRRRASPDPERGRSVEIDYANVEGLERVMREEKPSLILHVAGTTKGVTYGDFARGNVMPTKNLLEALVRAGHAPDRFLHVSSLAAYGPSSPERPHVEDFDRKPIEFYGKSKHEAEVTVESYGDRIPYTIIRPGGVYGPGDVDYFQLFKSVHRGLNVFFGNRTRTMSIVHVDDLVKAILTAARSDTTQNKGYFICDGAPVSFEEFQRCIVDASGRPVRDVDLPEFLVGLAAFGGELLSGIDGKPRLFNRQKAAMGRQDAWTCTHQAAKKDFGYAVTVPRTEGVRQTFEWYRSAGWL